MRNALAFLLLLLLCRSSIGQSTRAKAPVTPAGMEVSERAQLIQATARLARGEFEPAVRALSALVVPAVVPVYANWTLVPRNQRADFQRAAQEAVRAWNESLGGTPRFVWTDHDEEADLLLLFARDVAQRAAMTGPSATTPGAGSTNRALAVPVAPSASLVCLDTRLDEPPDDAKTAWRRTMTAQVAVFIPGSERPHTPSSITRLVGRCLGAYLGLSPSSDVGSIMGPDLHNAAAAPKPSAAEAAQFRQVEQVRANLLDLARKRTPVYMPYPELTVDKTYLDAGIVWQGESAHYVFTIRNNGESPLEIEAKPNCGCTVTLAAHTIAAGVTGKIEAELRTTSLIGPVTKRIDVKSNDPARPYIALQMAANVKSVVEILPGDRPVIALQDGAPTTLELQVHIHGTESAVIREALCSAPYVTARAMPVTGANDADSPHKLVITIGTDAPFGRSVARVLLTTTSTRAPTAYVTVTCEKGICVAPVSVYMGTIRPGTQMPVTQLVTLSRRSGTFRVGRAVCDDPNVQVQLESQPGGAQCRLTLSYRGGWSAGTIRRMLTVETDEPKQPKIEIPVMATVLAGSGTR